MTADPKRFAKILFGQTLVRSGLWKRALRGWAERGAVIILTYHRVIEKWDSALEYSQPGMVVTGRTFERQIARYVRRWLSQTRTGGGVVRVRAIAMLSRSASGR